MKVSIFDTSTGKIVANRTNDYDVTDIQLSSDGSTVMTVHKSWSIWRVSDSKVLYEKVIEGEGIEHMCATALSSDGKLALSFKQTGKVIKNYVMRVGDSKQIFNFNESQQIVQAAAFSPDCSLLITGGNNPQPLIFRVRDGAILHELRGFNVYGNAARDFRFSGDNRLVIARSVCPFLMMW
eukprot:CAMPEP_0167746660 /NCGR_PEP_ID=MMETSP0110_2-20121227/3836_1 /TAXON_ID=629695 /ORGANISM="Gymnochlora sp., Strain CCMP2014" /LENGTH=180 /DNA_ID=CAMNT_0007631449 /DNA_START=237 /DNA_END=776 /DNA_ORIENTATION=+